MKIRCYTLFDITPTGVRGHSQRTSEVTWNQRRNQQRNWETFLQIATLRTHASNIAEPIPIFTKPADCGLGKVYTGVHKVWTFDFDFITPNAYRNGESDIGLLEADSDGIPMIIGLTESASLVPALDLYNDKKNTRFEIKK